MPKYIRGEVGSVKLERENGRGRGRDRARQEMDIVINYPYLIAYAVDLHKNNV